VAVLDAGGHAVVVKRADRASSLRPPPATAKARGALVFTPRAEARDGGAHWPPGFK